jgi:hypothetical protein
MPNLLRDRTTADLLVLMLAGTICLTVLGASTAVIVAGFVNPDDEHAGAVAVVADTLQMLISLLAGFLAGRTDAERVRREAPEKKDQP